MARIQVSFKNNDTESKLYKEVMKAYDKSAFIKECIRFYLDNRDTGLQESKENKEHKKGETGTNDIDNVDWEF